MTALIITALLAGQVMLATIVHALVRRHARERDRLINQLCHLAGQPWQPAPADQVEQVAQVEERGIPALVAWPEQLPDDEY